MPFKSWMLHFQFAPCKCIWERIEEDYYTHVRDLKEDAGSGLHSPGHRGIRLQTNLSSHFICNYSKFLK